MLRSGQLVIMFIRVVVSGSDRFTYHDDFGPTLNFKPKNNQYFLEDKLEFLDNPGEWFYDKNDGTLYVMTPDGGSPEGRDVRGKVTSLQFTTIVCNRIHVNSLVRLRTAPRNAPGT